MRNTINTLFIYFIKKHNQHMALFYRMYQNKRTGDQKDFWYARAAITEETNLAALAERIQRNCTAKKSDVMAVLAELVEVMTDELQASHRVKLDGFGAFKLGISSKGEADKADFTVSKNIKGVHVLFQPELHISADRTRQKTFLSGITVQELPAYTDAKSADSSNSGSTDSGSTVEP